jgi:uncharacterized protein YdhG (YjbR/CyaY superfamily)
MTGRRTASKDISDYISRFPDKVQKILEEVRAAIRKAAPDAQELISYRIPAFTLQGRILVYFAAFKNHIGFYPKTTAIKKFKKELSAYETAKGTVRFPFDKPAPLTLIGEIVKFRVKENRERIGAKPKKK